MIVGNPLRLAIESGITRLEESPGFLALGFFVIHVGGCRYGVKEEDATMLGNSFYEVSRRVTHRGRHQTLFAAEASAAEIATKFIRALYADVDDDELLSGFFGMEVGKLTEEIYGNHLMWAPDGDEAFDDRSFVIQFDVEDRVRVIALTRDEEYGFAPETLREEWLPAEEFYWILDTWRANFEAELAALPKIAQINSEGL